MKKGRRTRRRILEEAAGLFSLRGYAGASVSDVMDATGLEKGGIYRHFDSKQKLAADAFVLAVERMRGRFARAMHDRESALDRLDAVVEVFTDLAEEPPVPGGCPIMNAAIEHDDGDRLLRETTRGGMDALRAMIRALVEEGRAGGELRDDADPEGVATLVVATMEGGVVLSRLYGDPVHVERTARHVRGILAGFAREEAR